MLISFDFCASFFYKIFLSSSLCGTKKENNKFKNSSSDCLSEIIWV